MTQSSQLYNYSIVKDYNHDDTLEYNKCRHLNFFEGKNKFCKDCNIFLIDNVETYRESIYESRTGVHAELE